MAHTSPPSMTAAPTPAPQRGDRTTFSARMDAFITWLAVSVAEFFALATNVYNNAVDAYNSSVSSATSATASSSSAAEASAAAISAASVDGAGDTSWLSMDRGAIKFAIEQAALANSGVKSLNRINQQQGEFTLYNYGVVSGGVVSKKGTGRLLSIAAGVCYLEGRKFYVPVQDSAGAVPDGVAGGSSVVYAYLELVLGIPTLKVSTIASPTPPTSTVTLLSITIPASDAGADLTACTLSSRLCATELDYPNSVGTPVTYTVPLANVLPDTGYTIEFEVLSAVGSPCDERSLKVTTRNTNNFIVTLYSAADDVVVRWKLSRLNAVGAHPENDWRARFTANPANVNYPTNQAY